MAVQSHVDRQVESVMQNTPPGLRKLWGFLPKGSLKKYFDNPVETYEEFVRQVVTFLSLRDQSGKSRISHRDLIDFFESLGPRIKLPTKNIEKVFFRSQRQSPAALIQFGSGLFKSLSLPLKMK